jgi:hypothetical protein
VKRISRFVVRLGFGFALSLGICAVAQGQTPVGSYLRLDAQVVGPSTSPTLDSTIDLSGGDTVKWVHYFASRQSAPWVADAEQVMPAGFLWRAGQLKAPPNTSVKWKVGSNWVTQEPADAAALSALAWHTDPMLRIEFSSPTQRAVSFSDTGDGFRVIPYNGKLYLVNHHARESARPLNCRVALTGDRCPDFPADGKGVAFSGTADTPLVSSSGLQSITPENALEALNYATGELFVGVSTPSNTQVVCTNLNTLKSCGSWTYSDVKWNGGSTREIRSIQTLANLDTIGSKYFLLVATGGSNAKLLCYNISTKEPCGTTSYTLPRDRNGDHQNNMRFYTSGQLDGKLFFATKDRIWCHDPGTGAPCTGAGWGGVNGVKNGANSEGQVNRLWRISGGVVPIPLATQTGGPRGVCSTDPDYVDACRAIDGTVFTLTANATSFIRNNRSWAGEQYADMELGTVAGHFNAVSGPRIYMPSSTGKGVSCFDFSTDSVCPGFPMYASASDRKDKAYSVRFDPNRPNCLLVGGHGPKDEGATNLMPHEYPIFYMINVNTLGACSDSGSASGQNTLTVTPADYYKCDPVNARVDGWDSVRVSPTLAWGQNGLSGIEVTLKKADGTPLPEGLRNWSFPSGTYTLDISSVPYSEYPTLMVELKMLSAGTLSSTTAVGADVTWKGGPRQLCFQTQAPNPAACETTSKLTVTTGLAPAPGTPLETVVADKVLWSGVGSEGYAAAAVATSTRALSSSLSSGEGRTYLLQGRYDLRTFSGDLWGLTLDSSDKLEVNARVKASTGLTAANASARPMYLAKPDARGNMSIVSLALSNASTEQQAALNLGLDGRIDGKGAARLEYLRGIDGSVGFRARGGRLLGPVINSAPALIPVRAIAGLPEASHPGYAEFRNTVSRTHPMVVWGGNDGAVHAAEVKSSGLEEAWSLVPNVMLRKAAKFSDPALADIRLSPHFVDNVPMVGHADTGGTSGWKTVAVVTFGRGARAITAIDVTKTTLSQGAGVLFEYTNETHADLRDLGYIVSSPISSEALGSHQIVKLNNNRWAVLVGNGVDSNDQSDGGVAASGTGRPVLYAFYLDGASPRWSRFAVDELLASQSVAQTATQRVALSTGNGLSTPRPVDVNGDGKVDIVYAGDIKGNLWRFDLKNVSAPTVRNLYAAGAERPIHGAPVVVRNGRSGACPVAQTNGCWQVTFGTGAYLSPLRGTSNATLQRIVSILDVGNSSTTTDGVLVQQPYETLTSSASSVEFRFSAGAVINYLSGKRGWWIELGSREHTVSAPMLLPNGQVRLSTVRPTGIEALQCKPARSWVFQADPAVGPPTVDSFDFNNDGVIDAQDRMVSGADLEANGGTNFKRPPLAMAVSGTQLATPGLLLARKVGANSASLVFPSLNIDTGTHTGGAAGANGAAVASEPAASGLVRVGDRKTLGRVSWRSAR